MAHQALKKNNKITAVFAANNVITFGTIKALGRLDGELSDQYQEVVLPANIVVRQSSGGVRELTVL